MEKSMKRGIRRWRSYSKWMYRLRGDWVTHGRQYNIYPIYDFGGPDPKKIVGWRNNLCPCFDLKNKDALRFKDTPTGNESRAAYRKKDGYHEQREWEERKLEVLRPLFGKTKRGVAKVAKFRRWKVQCHGCGYLIRVVRLVDDWQTFRDYLGKFHGNKYFVKCEACRKNREAR